jgi:hypothetical protein
MKFDELTIEKLEKEVLIKFGLLFKNSINEFSTSIDRSLKYLDKIVLPLVIASKESKSYNPFAQIIEKYAIHILANKLEKEGYRLLPLGYSADLTLESDQHILSIDVKTANLDNPSDFEGTIPVGINQITHVARLSIDKDFLPPPYYVYPTIPPFYELDGNIKLVLTYGLMFIYPPYRDLVEDIRKDYNQLSKFFRRKVRSVLVPILSETLKVSQEKAEQTLDSKPEKSRYTREELIAESIIRGIFIHKQQKDEILGSLNINSNDRKIIDEFSDKLNTFSEKLRRKDIKPIAIVAISIPNGLLKEKYIDKFVSGKNYSKSARYHYQDGVFEVIKERTGEKFPRVIFLDVNEMYLGELRKHFKEIKRLDIVLKPL